MATKTYTLEFVGGPFDGHRQPVATAPTTLVPIAALPVNENIFRMLEGQPTGPQAPTSSVAVYHLQFDEELGWRYRFGGSRLACELNLDGWNV